ncbi:hypothetical protein HPB49_012339 [Dermacentor silvarum]|uniref:Uncharacterized protein n=1 Tax=Dermacentor silvarum TaxID=543639 RepID=A0ACB8CF61_DERSI|nr:hypothetical protein HPB49_012339 [Dermacentor silvarum]
MYSPPISRAHRFGTLIAKTLQLVQHRSLQIVGDINAAHIGCGYLTSTPKGKCLLNRPQQHRLTLTANHSYPTRIGTSTTRDTTPDLTFARNIPQWEWQNLNETPGSDHRVAQLQIQVQLNL